MVCAQKKTGRVSTPAAAMSRSKREIPHYYLSEDVPLAAATAYLAKLNATRGVAERLLLAPLLLQAVARSIFILHRAAI